MAYIEPTPADLKARFPVFASVADPVVQTVIDEAGRRVDQTWPEEDYTLAKMLYAAHVMALDGIGSSREIQLLGFERIRVGPLDLQRQSTSRMTNMPKLGELASTSYGQRFIELAKANFAGGLAVGGPPYCDVVCE